MKEKITAIIHGYARQPLTLDNLDKLADELMAVLPSPVNVELTDKQIAALHGFAIEGGQPSYTITHTTIPAQDEFPEYTGLIAYSGSVNAGALLLDDYGNDDNESD